MRRIILCAALLVAAMPMVEGGTGTCTITLSSPPTLWQKIVLLWKIHTCS